MASESSYARRQMGCSQVDSKMKGKRFAEIYESLPTDAQQALVEKQLMPLLHLVDKGKSRKVLSAAKKLQKKHTGIPKLDIKAKKVEINGLMEELHRDAKRAFVKERSQKTELLSEIVDSLTSWLNDIWIVVYEHNVNFPLAHNCLLFVAHSLDHISHGRTGCSCAFANMFIPLTLKRSDGRRIKSFAINGAHNLEEILLFIWRDMFLSLLASGNSRYISKIPEMLSEIEELLGWTAIERLLYGGKKCPHEKDEEELWEDDDEDEYVTESEDDYIDDTDLEEFDEPVHCAKHWSLRVQNQTSQLRRYVLDSMVSVFKLNPSLRLYSALLVVSTDPDSTEVEVARHLATIATSCSDTFAAALDIYSLQANDADTIASLLESHSHLLRPRDARVLQSAVSCLALNPSHHARALQTIEKELLDTARAVRYALMSPFSQLEMPANRDEILDIIKQRPGAAGRQERVELWVDAITTPGAPTQNPMAFAALLIGLPIPPDMDPADEDHTAGFLDFDPLDPDLDDLREEFRPKLKQRFEGWSDVARTVKGGQPVQMKVYKTLIEMMPFLRANDVVEEMVNRLADKPSKHHVCDGLDALLNFVKVQRRKASMQKMEAKARKESARPLSAGTTAAPSTSTNRPHTPPDPDHASIYSLFVPQAHNTGMGGMEDVD